jgi:hypothetical protein
MGDKYTKTPKEVAYRAVKENKIPVYSVSTTILLSLTSTIP